MKCCNLSEFNLVGLVVYYKNINTGLSNFNARFAANVERLATHIEKANDCIFSCSVYGGNEGFGCDINAVSSYIFDTGAVCNFNGTFCVYA